MKKEKVIAHIDLNAFFAQCEILEHPELKGKPIAIGSDTRRSVLSTASYEARKYGVHSAMPVGEAKRRCPKLILIPGNYKLYEYYSRTFFTYLRKRFPILEQASIDECYIDMTEESKGQNLNDFLFDLQMSLYNATNLQCSIGAGKNKFVAKMGSDLRKPLGLTIIDETNIQELLWPLSIDKMFGIGKKSAPRLIDLGIETIGDLAKTKDPEVIRFLGSRFDALQGEANGEGDDFVDNRPSIPKSCSAERTFPDDVSDYDEIRKMIYACSEDVSYELRHYKLLATNVSLKLRNNEFHTISHRMNLSKPSDKANDIYVAAMDILDDIYDDYPLRLLGVCAEKVVSVEEKKKGPDPKVDELLKNLNSKLNGKLIRGSQLEKKDENE